MSHANVNPYGYSRLLDEDGSSSSSDGSRGDLQPGVSGLWPFARFRAVAVPQLHASC